MIISANLSGFVSAQSVTGVVTNRTNGRPVVGDDVVLLKLAQGMQELARAKTDVKGHFTLSVPDAGLHLVRVTHDKANYFKPLPPGTKSLEIEVFSARGEVDGITLAEDVMQIQTDPGGTSLRVVEHFLVKNESSPAVTLFNEHPFEFYLPAGATLDGGSAKAPAGMAVETPVVPTGENNRYTMIFPIRPGDTEFNVWYKVPYTGSFSFQPRPLMTTGALGIMMPAGMTFKAAPSAPYKTVTEELPGRAQAYVATNVAPSQPLGFTVAGKGELPRDNAESGAQGSANGTDQKAGVPGDPRADTRPGGGLGVPVDKDAERDPWTKYRWWIIGALGLTLVTAAGILLRVPVGSTDPGVARDVSGTSAVPQQNALDVLRNEMFAVETDRLRGHLDEAQYAQLKSAYDLILKRALSRQGTGEV